jgi:hypothetical protein
MTLTSHDVRRIKVCSQCGSIGIYKPKRSEVEVPLVICTNSLRANGKVADYQHIECYAPGERFTKLALLPLEELQAIRMCDVSMKTMKALLKVKAHRPAIAEARERGK